MFNTYMTDKVVSCAAAGFLLSSLLFSSGCATVGPDYQRPQLAMPEAWHSKTAVGIVQGKPDAAQLAAWWTRLGDPQLSGFIERAVAKNLDLKKARAKIMEARAKRGVAQADLFPTLSGSGSATWTRSGYISGKSSMNKLYSSSLDAAWELDLFGGVRRSVEAYDADLGASEEDLRDTLVTLLSEVALNYTDVRTYQARIAAAEKTLKSQEDTYQLTVWKREAGLSDDLAVKQALYNLESSRAKLPALRSGLDSAMNNIAVLLGEAPGKVHAELKAVKPIPSAPVALTIGVPADILRQRPDVRRAERQLAAQTARIGVAEAELYPKLTLNGSIGLEATALSHLSSSGIWSAAGGPSVTWAIFKGGSIRENIKAQTALQEQYLAAYEASVLTALKEVENALVAYAEELKHRQSLSAAVSAADEASVMAGVKYEAGLVDLLTVLDAQRSLFSYRDELAQSEGSLASDIVRLYKALGGGWSSMAGEDRNKTDMTMEKENGR
jgi:NodT family efflux transporter outer membrane factor (OMF) lipoprotein